jgi:hypothetical protein
MKAGMLIILLALGASTGTAPAADDLAKNFAAPPPSARPWVYLFPLDGNISREGITADLEAMQRVGIGGVLYMEVDQGAPKGPALFGGPLWRDLFKHICAESQRLGLAVNMNNDAGWCGSGGPWITPELSMQKVVWTETKVAGPQRFDAALPQAPAVKDYYRDIALFAIPAPAADYRIPRVAAKSAAEPEEVGLRASFPALPPDTVVPRGNIVGLTDKLGPGGRLAWDVPAGDWRLLRIGCTTTGKENHPAPPEGRGLECDKLSKQAAEAHFNGLMGRLIEDNKPLVGENQTLVATHIDSWEVHSQNWTPEFRNEFRRLRGYDPLPLLPVFSGCVVDSVEVSERFLWDVRQTVNDLICENYAGHFRDLAHRHGLRFSMEAYGDPPFDDVMCAGRADEPMAEFWSYTRSEFGFGRRHYSCAEMASAAHVYGRPIVGAEAFTATNDEKWQAHPASMKELGDWAFCEGINRFVFHRYALQPWTNPDRPPGMSMGPWGLHYERTQTWWDQTKPWHEYLARCQYLLQQGLFVADLCYLAPERSPQRIKPPGGTKRSRPGHNFDLCPAEVVLTRMSVRDGRLVLPDGMSYRMLVLPRVETMTPKLLRKIRDLVNDGAIVLGAPPVKSPSLQDYPQCDKEVQALAQELWGDRAGEDGSSSNQQPTAPIVDRSLGRGRIIWPAELRKVPDPVYNPPSVLTRAKWIWTDEVKRGLALPAGTRHFRRTFEIEAGRRIDSARLVLTADNSFTCMVNGQPVCNGHNYKLGQHAEVAGRLKPGANEIIVAAVNSTDTPNPAGLVAALDIKFADGTTHEICTNASWQAAQSATGPWGAVRELGPMGMEPWGEINEQPPALNETTDIAIPSRVLAQLGVPPDFEASTQLGHIHKRIGEVDLYFVANPEPRAIEVSCAFRVSGRVPELWWPDSGRIEPAGEWEMAGEVTRVPLRLDPSGSVFVVFRTMTGDRSRQTTPRLAPQLVQELSGPWEVAFDPKWGGPGRVSFGRLDDWSTRPESGIKYYSGAAIYQINFNLASGTDLRHCQLDLGRVEVIAEATLNGKPLGTLWKPPYRVDVSDAVRPGENTLEVKVVNQWINRMIGDEQLPEDSDRNPNGTLKSWPQWLHEGQASPTGRFTFTSWRLWKKADPLAPSGLLGPVRIMTTKPASR